MTNKTTDTILSLLFVIAIIAGLAWAALYASDNIYMRKCSVVWHDCDEQAIKKFEQKGCEIIGDSEGHKWGECND